MNDLENNTLREEEIDIVREKFEASCSCIVSDLTGSDDVYSGKAWAFDYDSVSYLNLWTDACWQSFVKGMKS